MTSSRCHCSRPRKPFLPDIRLTISPFVTSSVPTECCTVIWPPRPMLRGTVQQRSRGRSLGLGVLLLSSRVCTFSEFRVLDRHLAPPGYTGSQFDRARLIVADRPL